MRDDLNKNRYEIIDGKRVIMPEMWVSECVVAQHLAFPIANYAEESLGLACQYLLYLLPNGRQRRPLASFVPYSRWPRAKRLPDTDYWAVTPELCIEIGGSQVPAGYLREKMEDYFVAGVRVVWVVYPDLELVDVYETGSAVRTLRRADSLDGGQVLPGFTLPLAELFPAVQ